MWQFLVCFRHHDLVVMVTRHHQDTKRRSIFSHMVGHIVRSQKYVEIAKIAILVINSIFDTAADIGQNGDIWPEMGS